MNCCCSSCSCEMYARDHLALAHRVNVIQYHLIHIAFYIQSSLFFPHCSLHHNTTVLSLIRFGWFLRVTVDIQTSVDSNGKQKCINKNHALRIKMKIYILCIMFVQHINNIFFLFEKYSTKEKQKSKSFHKR